MTGVVRNKKQGFTIVELLIVIVVIAILAAITIVSYNGITKRAVEAGMKSDLHSGATSVGIVNTTDGAYPTSLPATISASSGNTFTYTSDGTNFCLSISTTKAALPSYYITQDGTITEGICTLNMQTMTAANCPSTRTMVTDKRDNHTYWVQKFGSLCWMSTNLSYAGGGDTTYSDVISTSNLTEGSASGSTYTAARYYIPTGDGTTTSPTAPSVATTGLGQYGYMYNFCAANGNQAGNGACSGSLSTAVTTTVSICPAGWRLPTGNTSGEFVSLNTAANSGATNTNAGLRTNWLIQYSGYWYGSWVSNNTTSLYWSSTQSSASNAYSLNSNASYVGFDNSTNKRDAYPVRCVAS